MKASTNINGMFAKNYFSVPSYQRAYSWDTELEPSKPPKQVNMFLSDLEEHCNIKGGNSKYYLGHFLFEKRIDGKYDIVDGQQRATTIVIFVSALLCCLKNINPKNEKLGEYKNKFIKE
ncbi:uncharacterized protein DUF262 [Pasteurella langaaensis DSM 22999]|uniref:Uncharacterized protein DUF262 n=1 Tax=Alitibacter langaaensis DSM 22999 TaxID=1122935 RepID=A0A2U0TGY4_9PAST|nr:DUF262 domain-containing protein [Pasteurella langaaensis]PVX42871.1 uncharacterized protein DUF262 [Pasteurella langaaensis DSM 22999]